MFFLKSLLSEKDARIKQLQDEVAFLRSQLQPKATPVYRNVHFEANAILNGQSEQIIDEMPEDPAIIAEREKILSGTY